MNYLDLVLTGVPFSDEHEVAVSEGSDDEIEIGIKSGGSPPAPSPQTGIVEGAVTKPDGTPAPAATITLSQSGVERFKKTTDAGGKFRIDSVPTGQYDVEASLTPHAPSDRSRVNVTAGGQSFSFLAYVSRFLSAPNVT